MSGPTDKQKEEARRIINGSSCSPMFGFGDLVEKIATAFSARDAEIRAVLEGLAWSVDLGGGEVVMHWCDSGEQCGPECEATRTLWKKLQPGKEGATT